MKFKNFFSDVHYFCAGFGELMAVVLLYSSHISYEHVINLIIYTFNFLKH